ncbi:TolC family protein [Fulvivirgaceae bacterium BMA10]|uniref:TolC family protein n=1 Tax=Splendidivirga corallicola TaxID=3051826 RepID=A0ABT8KVR1_9BACT|nr:TolC family protein [Fulvivirgaceae bacterium BMA10]
MNKSIVLALSVCLCSLSVIAQTNDIDKVLREIEQNNKSLQTHAALIESKRLELKAGNNLPDPQATAYYLPFGTHTSGDYTEFQISQSFEFPSVYAVRKGLIEQQVEALKLEYAVLRQELLLPAKQHCLELIYLNKKIAVEQLRVQQANQVFEQIRELFEKEQVGILELNKAKIAWMQEQFTIQQIENDKHNLLLLLQKLNGGNEVLFDQSSYSGSLNSYSLDSIWQDKKTNDPAVKILERKQEVALQQIKLSKNKALPNLTAGFNHQGVSGETFSGFYGGLSIPLWNNRNKIKAARSQYRYQQTFTDAYVLEIYSNFQKQFNEYQLLLGKFKEYQSTLSGLHSDALLLEAYQLGEISFIEYYTELQFYRQAFNTLLQMEKELNQLIAELLKHQL